MVLVLYANLDVVLRLLLDVVFDVLRFGIWFSLQVLGEQNCALNVFTLSRFVPACEKHNDLAATFCVINPVSRTYFNLQFKHSITKKSMRSRMTVHQSVHSNLNSRAAGLVFEPVDLA